jgi:predicted RNase H-like HicB family nuclease
MRYRVVVEYDTETGHYAATVPGVPGLFVDAKTEREALKLVREGIRFHLGESAHTGREKRSAPKRLPAKIVTVEV